MPSRASGARGRGYALGAEWRAGESGSMMRRGSCAAGCRSWRHCPCSTCGGADLYRPVRGDAAECGGRDAATGARRTGRLCNRSRLGDGRIVIAAVKQHGAAAWGSKSGRSRQHGPARGGAQASRPRRIPERSLFVTDIISATVLTLYLMPVSIALRPRVFAELKPGTRVVSHDFDMGNGQADESVTVAVPGNATARLRAMFPLGRARMPPAPCSAPGSRRARP